MSRSSAYTVQGVVLGTTSSGNNASGSHTVTAGSNLGLLVLIGTHQGTISTVTWNGVSLTKIAEGASAFNECGSTWYLLGPTPGTGNVVVSMSGGSWYGWTAVNLSNIKNTGTLTNATAGSSGSPATVNITPATDNNVIFTVVGTEAIPTAGTGLTTLNILQGQSFENSGSAYIAQTSATAQTMSFTLDSGQRWGIAAVAIEPFAVTTVYNRTSAGTRTVAGIRTLAT